MSTLEDNWSLVVPEAMACGLPIVCSVYNGCHPELIKNDENGWVFDPLEAEDTFAKLAQCLENMDRLKEMGQKSKAIARKFTPGLAADSIIGACKIAYRRVQD